MSAPCFLRCRRSPAVGMPWAKRPRRGLGTPIHGLCGEVWASVPNGAEGGDAPHGGLANPQPGEQRSLASLHRRAGPFLHLAPIAIRCCRPSQAGDNRPHPGVNSLASHTPSCATGRHGGWLTAQSDSGQQAATSTHQNGNQGFGHLASQCC